MEVGGTEGRARVEHAAEGRAVPFILGSPHLQAQMRHGAMDSNRNLRLRGLGRKDYDILEESDVTAANDASVRRATRNGGDTEHVRCVDDLSALLT